MRINTIKNTRINKPIFKSCCRTYSPTDINHFGIFNKLDIQTSTKLFRKDVNWITLIKYAITHFNNKKNVNAYSLAASDCSEAYTYLISTMESIPKNLYKKFMHINASDIDAEIIKGYNSGRINVFAIEFWHAEKNFNVDLSKYLKNRAVSISIDGDEISDSDTISSYEPILVLRNAIKYRQSDILTELRNIKDYGNSIVMCRNVFPYLNENYINDVVNIAKNKLKTGSLFITGSYDTSTDIYTKLFNSGFKRPIESELNIFERK